MRRHLCLLLLLAPLAAKDLPQIDWVGDWDEALKLAQERDVPIMVCINSKDGEPGSDRTAKTVYRDAEFVKKSAELVMVVASTELHWTKDACPRFGKVTCKQHQSCWKQLSSNFGDQLSTANQPGVFISPQHVWFKPDGTMLRRLEYETRPPERMQPELLKRMQRAIDEVAGKIDPGLGLDTPTPGQKDAPLDEKERAELKVLETTIDAERRKAAVGNLLATEKMAAQAALVDLLQATKKNAVKCDILKGLGRAQVADARIFIEECLKDKDELVRSFAAVALENLADKDSIPALLKRKSERDTTARKNVYRALGVCAGPVADKAAAKLLLKAVNSDKQAVVKKHAALALKSFNTDEAKKLVVKRLEQHCQRTKDREVRGAVIYTLAYIGNTKTTLPVFKKILEQVHEPMSKNYIREAINVLRGNAGEFGRAAWWIFREDRDDPARRD